LYQITEMKASQVLSFGLRGLTQWVLWIGYSVESFGVATIRRVEVMEVEVPVPLRTRRRCEML